jgi:hypothetical protein
MVNVEGVVGRVVGTTEAIVRQTKVLARNLVAIFVIVKLHVGEAHTGNISKGDKRRRLPHDVSLGNIGSTRVILQDIRDKAVGIIQKTHEVVRLSMHVLSFGGRQAKESQSKLHDEDE